MSKPLKIQRDGPRAWRLSDPYDGADVGGVDYIHAADGNHYRPWLFVDGTRHDVGDPVPQLPMAARAVEQARAVSPKT
jgi:hypothetical protein